MEPEIIIGVDADVYINGKHVYTVIGHKHETAQELRKRVLDSIQVCMSIEGYNLRHTEPDSRD